jgi:hypothetical protein
MAKMLILKNLIYYPLSLLLILLLELQPGEVFRPRLIVYFIDFSLFQHLLYHIDYNYGKVMIIKSLGLWIKNII